MSQNKWPKTIPPLNAVQQAALDDWMKYWLEILVSKFGIVEKFNHGYPVKLGLPVNAGGVIKTLEVGAGLGEHYKWENQKSQNYTMLEYREELCQLLRKKYPEQTILHGDIQKKLNFSDGHFDRVIAIHVLEHLPDLPRALAEVYRLLKTGGIFDVVIPCEGGPMYEIVRSLTSARMFKKRFGISYRPIMRAEHINTCAEIKGLLKDGWKREHSTYFPFYIPIWQANLIMGLRLTKL